MKVLFVRTRKSFLPELRAYRSHLVERGHTADVIEDCAAPAPAKDYDLLFRFGGVLRRLADSQTPEVHEYHSASTGRMPRVRNLVKSFVSPRPAGRVFLNDFVRRQYFFFHGAPFILREMGADPSLLTIRAKRTRLYDVVYAGSISGRPGVIDSILSLARRGASVGVAGIASADEVRRLLSHPRVRYEGRLDTEAVPDFLAAGRLGLNYCPDKYPFNRQTSTKVIEYLVAGLPVLSNRYRWIEDHSTRHGYRYLDIAQFVDVEAALGAARTVMGLGAVEQFTWPSVLTRSDFVGFLTSIAATPRDGLGTQGA